MFELQHEQVDVPDFPHSRALNIYAVHLMKIFLRSGFASETKGSLGSNTLSY